eukprot:GHVS01090337.1.p1 GENE.GHVS01090337.1~~GHVS01090337.1.p1  ORF type:complete len:127 (+),score=20.69 GHVS01090337.1:156-536(+)
MTSSSRTKLTTVKAGRGCYGNYNVPSEDEKRRFRVAWEEGLRQLGKRFDEWVGEEEQSQLSDQQLLYAVVPQAIRVQVHEAQGVDRKFLAMRNAVGELHRRNCHLSCCCAVAGNYIPRNKKRPTER